ncbi:unnamed protein product [Microthlaspi erraticum]|uniref:Uncharacterized protein n=1 Tax=Microthlaspi erraticum TaxID=1685480 RepID=A0A6D2I3Q1_9BRAS|nr:unnamed protein product [Microthlaspi erraticum]
MTSPPSSSIKKLRVRGEESHAAAEANRCQNRERTAAIPAAHSDADREATAPVDRRRASPVRRSRRESIPTQRLLSSAATARVAVDLLVRVVTIVRETSLWLQVFITPSSVAVVIVAGVICHCPEGLSVAVSCSAGEGVRVAESSFHFRFSQKRLR